ncbi:hypothetical protein [Nocardia sp. NPDC019255]|uniref:hypothetical protein n=1 Tax=Nocardia sp. NPDC019255 TaxID=3154591 RepID=UPI00340AC6D7
MTQPVVFGLVEVALADYLGASMAVPVFNNVPHVRPPEYVLVVRVGGSLSNRITDRPRIVAECCAEVGTAAADLASVVRARIGAVAPGYVGDIWVDKVIDMGVAYSPDPGTNLPRYLVTAELHVRGAVLA